MNFFNIQNRNVISYIFNKFDICDYNDVKKLANMMLINNLFYSTIYSIIEHLIKFYQQEFELLGHKEAIKSKDMRIIRYLDSRYKKYNNFEIYIDDIDSMNYIYLICELKFYDLIDYLFINKYKNISYFKNGLIKNNDYEAFVKYMKLGLYTEQDINKFDIFDIIMSDNPLYFKHHNIKRYGKLPEYYIISLIENEKYNSLNIYFNYGFANKESFIKYAKSIKMLYYLISKNSIIKYLNEELLISTLHSCNTFEVFDHIVELTKKHKIKLSKEKILNTLDDIYHLSQKDDAYLYIEKIANTFNIDRLKIINKIKYKNDKIDIYTLDNYNYFYNIDKKLINFISIFNDMIKGDINFDDGLFNTIIKEYPDILHNFSNVKFNEYNLLDLNTLKSLQKYTDSDILLQIKLSIRRILDIFKINGYSDDIESKPGDKYE